MINGYDFDETIYNGDSSVDFYKYCLRRKKKVLMYLPIQVWGAFLYGIKKIDKTEFKEKVFSFLKGIDSIDEYVEDFWNGHKKKIKDWYLKQKEATDVIISASPEFLLKPMEKYLGVKVIASKVEKKTGRFTGKNCHDYEKITRFEKEYPKKKIKAFYTDSMKADYPMMEYAEEAYLVTKEEIKKIPKEEIKRK